MPNDTEPNLMRPKSSPTAIVRPKISTACAIEFDVNRLTNQSIPLLFYCYYVASNLIQRKGSTF